ncbi:hypothetical protein NQ318_020723 [Aromia moschata]|uniref:RAE1/2 domain-containing protein n=1 Tax=Aromia moschata TaxID=1265417 RepID=A0AAV8YX92_9CUCU|nr:hypothetical protein NQ318_020723 [Aromia moschata]
MYGSGETTQAFCRLSAVFGGVYALGQPVNGLVFAKDQFKSLIVGEQRINADHIVMGIEKSPEKFVQSFTKTYISRAVFITDKSVMASEKEHLTLLLYPPENNKNPVTIIELGNIVHLISRQISTPQEDLKHVAENLFNVDNANEKDCSSAKPSVLWSCYFSLPDSNGCNLKENVPKHVHLCPGPDMDLDYDMSIKKAKEIFFELYPDTDFLPRAPDPEEIVIEGEEVICDDTLKEEKEDSEKENTVVAELIRNIEKHDLHEEDTDGELPCKILPLDNE